MGLCLVKKIYEKEGLEGLKNKPRTGNRPSELSEEDISQQYKNNVKRKQPRLDHKTSRRINHIKKSGIKYHYTHIYPASFVNGFKQKVPRKIHVNTASQEEKEAFKKRHRTDACG